jgi:hypothetical protein
MKQVLAFIRWNFNRMKWHDYLWMLGCGLTGAGYVGEHDAMFYIGGLIIVSMCFGALIKFQWLRWKMEREELLNTIKNSNS